MQTKSAIGISRIDVDLSTLWPPKRCALARAHTHTRVQVVVAMQNCGATDVNCTDVVLQVLNYTETCMRNYRDTRSADPLNEVRDVLITS
jgi:hypothetical protein